MYIKNNKIYIYNNDIKSFKKNQFHRFLKESIFSGRIIIFRNNYFIIKIINLVSNLIQEYLKTESITDLNIKNNNIKKFDNLIINIQKNIKNNTKLKKVFGSFLNFIEFSNHETFIDKITLRYTSPLKSQTIGILKPLISHRDTWGSNIPEQVNWWLPLSDIKNQNSIFILRKEFNRPVKNDSKEWNFLKYKKDSKRLSSSPTSSKEFIIQPESIIRIKRGDLLCFSGHHLHGSKQDDFYRVNLETRTVSKNDSKIFKIPRNIDNFQKKKQLNWFFNIFNSSVLGKSNY